MSDMTLIPSGLGGGFGGEAGAAAVGGGIGGLIGSWIGNGWVAVVVGAVGVVVLVL